jgi:hypothetical protein
VCAAVLCAPSHRTAAACGIYSSARAARYGRARLRSARPAGCRARSAAGVTWTCRTASAPWAGRTDHTSVIDAAGAIYVLGGQGSTDYHDVWASTDGGARAGLGAGGGQGVLEWGTRVGYSTGVLDWGTRVRYSSEVLEWGTAEYCGVLGGTRGYHGGAGSSTGFLGIGESCSRGYPRGALGGTLGGTPGVL